MERICTDMVPEKNIPALMIYPHFISNHFFIPHSKVRTEFLHYSGPIDREGLTFKNIIGLFINQLNFAHLSIK
jgi:hypothetical protein